MASNRVADQPASELDVPSWCKKLRAICKDLLSTPFLGRGELYYYKRQEDFAVAQQRCTAILNGILQSLPESCGSLDASKMKEFDDVVEGVRSYVADAAERIDGALDKHAGAVATTVQQGATKTAASTTAGADAYAQAPSQKARADRPQDHFYPPVDNSNEPFVPSFAHLNGLKDESPPAVAKVERHAARLNPQKSGGEQARYPHPFSKALSALATSYPDWQLTHPEVHPPADLHGQALTLVQTEAELRDMVAHLQTVRELAVDLEHHSNRSFLGFTCLMQVSTRTRDFVVDVIALRNAVGAALAPIFADAAVQKVLHGADYDILWLQKDFGLFVVNMFDTGQAARILGMQCGLAHLLDLFCSVKTDKKFQRADWRKRPLPEDMLHYARIDTHYLLYIADQLRAKLLAAGAAVPPSLVVPIPAGAPQGALGLCLERSRQLCLLRYEKPLFRQTDYIRFYTKCGVALGQQALAVFAALFAWRDRTARALDEGVAFVLPRRLLITLAQNMPASVPAVVKVAGRASAVVTERAQEVLDVIKSARQQAVEAVPGLDGALALKPRPVAGELADEEPAPNALADDSPPASARASDGVSEASVSSLQAASDDGAAEEDRPGGDSGQEAAMPASQAVSFASLQRRNVGPGGGGAAPAAVPAAVSFAGLQRRNVGTGGVAVPATPAAPVSSLAGLFGGAPRSVAPVASARDVPASMSTMFGGAASAAAEAPAGVGGAQAEAQVPVGAADRVKATFVLPLAGADVPESEPDSSGDSEGSGGSGTGEDASAEAAPRDRGQEVRDAADALRAAAGLQAGSTGARRASPGDVEMEEEGDGEVLSLRERHRKVGGAQTPAEPQSALGEVTAISFRAHGALKEAKRAEKRLRSADDFEAFDYEAVLAEEDARGGRGPARGRGRGHGRGRGRGRGDRGGKAKGLFEGRTGGSYNPYALDEGKFMAGGKRSGTAPRSGNKSATFGRKR